MRKVNFMYDASSKADVIVKAGEIEEHGMVGDLIEYYGCFKTDDFVHLVMGPCNSPTGYR